MGGRKGQSNPKKVTKGNRKKSNSNEENKKLNCYYTNEQSYDKCHNSDIPCSNGIRDIVQNIFPEFLSRDEVPPFSAEETNEDLSSVVQSFQPSLLALLIRRHFLEKRLTEMSATAEYVNVSDKKKRKNKKKKKKSVEVATSNILLMNTITTQDRNVNDNRAVDEWDWNEDDQDDNHDDNHHQALESKDELGHADALKISTFVSQFMTENSLTSTSAMKTFSSINVKEKEQATKWADFLNQILLKNSDSMSTLQDLSLSTLAKNRSLSALLSYIQDRYEKTLEHKNTYRTQNVNPSSRYLPSISTSDISTIIERIQCRNCRNACHNYLECLTSSRSHLEVDWGGMRANGRSHQITPKEQEKESKTQIGTFILNENSILLSRRNPTTPSLLLNAQRSSEIDDHDVDYAFEYHQLEEGVGGDVIEVFDTNSPVNGAGSSSSIGGLCLDVVQDGAQGAKYIELDAGMNESVSPFSLRNMESFLKDVIVQCGLSYEVDPRISDEMTARIECKANELMTYYQNYIDSEKKLFLEFQSNLEDVKNSMEKTNFNASVSIILRKCLDAQKLYLDEVLKFVSFVDKSTKCAQVFQHEKKKWVSSFVDNLIQTFQTCSRSLIQFNFIRIWNMKQQQSDDSFVLLFNDATQRVFLTDYLVNTSIFMEELHRAFFVLNDDRCEAIQENGVTTTNFLAALSAYLLVVTEAYLYEIYPWEESLDAILKKRNEIVCITNLRLDATILLKELSDKQRIIYRGIFNEAIPQLDSNLKQKHLDSKQMSLWNANKIMMEESEIMDQNYKDFGFSMENDIAKSENLFDLVSILFKQKRYREDIELLSTHKKGDIKIPPCIYRGIQLGKLQQEDRCEGSNGERRVSSIISACLYGWLEKQCIEWHAELTQKELLLDAEEELLQVSNKQKKKRKGSNKKITTSAETSPEKHIGKDGTADDRSEEELVANSNLRLEPSTEIKLENSHDHLLPSTRSEMDVKTNELEEWTEVRDKKVSSKELKSLKSSESKTSTGSVVEQNPGDPKKDGSISMTENTKDDESNGQDEFTPTSNMCNVVDTYMDLESIPTYYSNLGVSDKGKVTRAEDFLCSRYFHVLEELKVSS